MSNSDAARHIAWFGRLDQMFWLAWAGLGVMTWLAYAAAVDPAVVAQLPPEQAACANILPQPAKMSALGKAMYWCLFAWQLSIYVILLTALHLIVNRFARGRIFVSETLATLGWLGGILVVWPFLDFAATELVARSLHAMGELPVYVPNYAIDIAPAAVGLFLIALRYVLGHAMGIKAEHDLTI